MAGLCEIKNRVSGIKRVIPQYEMDQISVYSELSGADLTYLVQAYSSEIKITGFSKEELKKNFDELVSSPVLFESAKKIQYYRDHPTSEDAISFAKEHLLAIFK
jgi:hypothetical protein